MKAFVTYLKRQSPPVQLASGSTGRVELPNGQRWNPGHAYKFNANEPARMKGGSVLRFLTAKSRVVFAMTRGRYGH